MEDKIQIEYSKPPISEAALQIKFEKSVSVKELEKAKLLFFEMYDSSKPIYSVMANIKPDGELNSSRVFEGTQFMSQLGDESCRIERDKFSVTQLAPYSGWAKFIERFKRDYKTLDEFENTPRISSISTRYVNRLDIPVNDSGMVRIEDYLNLYLNTPNPTDVVNHFSFRAALASNHENCSIIVNSTPVPSVIDDHFSIILDIEVEYKGDRDLNNEIFTLFDLVRDIKNDSFENFLTKKAKELFD